MNENCHSGSENMTVFKMEKTLFSKKKLKMLKVLNEFV